MTKTSGVYGSGHDPVDYILGITFEIWEAGGVELIERYYAADCTIYSLDGIVDGAAAVIDGTRALLAEFPDRRLLGDDVIWSDDGADGWYTSHRVGSPMTNSGATVYGPATGRHIRITNIADCIVEDGVITREWLVRDNRAFVAQLGFDPDVAARRIATNRSEQTARWFEQELGRLDGCGLSAGSPAKLADSNGAHGFAQTVLTAQWSSGDAAVLGSAYAPYAVLHRSPIEIHSGARALGEHFAMLRRAVRVNGFGIEHVATRQRGGTGFDIAVRWSLAGTHTGEFLGHGASKKPVFILGVTHWRIVAGRIAAEWTVFDSAGVLAQML